MNEPGDVSVFRLRVNGPFSRLTDVVIWVFVIWIVRGPTTSLPLTVMAMIFGGLPLLALLLDLVPGSAILRVNDEGLTITRRFVTGTVPWSAISNITSVRAVRFLVDGRVSVHTTQWPSSSRYAAAKQNITRLMVSSIPAPKFCTPEEFAQTLNERRNRSR